MERELEIQRQRQFEHSLKEIHEAEDRVLEAQESGPDIATNSAQKTSDAAILRGEARLLGSGASQPEPKAETRILQTKTLTEATADQAMGGRAFTPEQQELHKSAETSAEQPAGGPRRPSGEAVAEVERRHLVPAHVIGELDDHISRWTAGHDSRLQGRELTEKDIRILKGDAGEGRTYVDLLGRYERDRILHQPRFDDPDGVRTPDFAVASDKNPKTLVEIVDSKAWSLVRPLDAHGNPANNEDFFRYLQEHPEAGKLLNMGELQRVVGKYAASPRLEQEGKVVLYFPENVLRYAPQVQQRIEGWSGREIAHGHTVEVRSIGVWDQDLWKDVRGRSDR